MGELHLQKRIIEHYSSTHKILLVGEGDFSFSACLAKTFGSAANMVCTSLDSKETLLKKYKKVSKHLRILEDLGGCIMHEVDACWLMEHPLLQFQSFDRIIFNFPHAGFLFEESASQQIGVHQDLVRGFLWNARKMVSENGEIHITHKTTHPFSKWDIEKLGKEVGLTLIEKVKFHVKAYPGYENKRGDGANSNKKFHLGECSTFKFMTKLRF